MQRKNTDLILEKATPLTIEEHSRRVGLSVAALAVLSDVRRIVATNIYETELPFPSDVELDNLILQSGRVLGFELARFERDELISQLMRENSPFGILQSLVDNPDVSDIIVHNYSKIVVQCGRTTIRTDLAFADQKTYNTFVEKLLQRAETSYSTKKPIADGMIGNFARIHVVHQCLCESGPYLTIRINRMARVGFTELVEHGVAPIEVFNYLRKLVRHGLTIFVVGEVGTGKTTLVRALATAMPESESILVIEDTPEIQLEHPHVRALTTREINSEGVGRITPSECIRAGMRMAMNRIIFGEIRDAEAAEAFIDVCASGHPGISTIHARSAAEAITRLELFLGRAQRGAARQVLSEQIVTAVQCIVYVAICPLTGKRRIFEVKEIGPVADGIIRQRDIFQYTVNSGKPAWRVLTKSSAHREVIEQSPGAVVLSSYPAWLTLSQANEFPNFQLLSGSANDD